MQCTVNPIHSSKLPTGWPSNHITPRQSATTVHRTQANIPTINNNTSRKVVSYGRGTPATGARWGQSFGQVLINNLKKNFIA
jgi:hypothetical protein